ncbi:hypothetical protein Pmani_003465 [Petrolisthes manimaculis]|uniref:Uncharacterized protein n=1 Tax=Petrolisthes manimaculis TaxID=1843537 RepID=A0AAE1UPZ6_9EUCA|nr:hypothetical protein Pmani_003465 [Petrolisthes manimaculis]
MKRFRLEMRQVVMKRLHGFRNEVSGEGEVRQQEVRLEMWKESGQAMMVRQGMRRRSDTRRGRGPPSHFLACQSYKSGPRGRTVWVSETSQVVASTPDYSLATLSLKNRVDLIVRANLISIIVLIEVEVTWRSGNNDLVNKGGDNDLVNKGDDKDLVNKGGDKTTDGDGLAWGTGEKGREGH